MPLAIWAYVSFRKDVELKPADMFHGLGHFEFLEEHEEPSNAASKREDAAPKPSPKRLQCSCTFKKANMQPVAKGNSFIEESNRYKNKVLEVFRHVHTTTFETITKRLEESIICKVRATLAHFTSIRRRMFVGKLVHCSDVHLLLWRFVELRQ